MKDESDNATIDIEDAIKGMHRRNDHATSIKAARGVRRWTLREEVIQFALDAGYNGFTDDDLKAAWAYRPESSLRKRRTELTQENILLATALTRQNRFGQEERVWCHRDRHRYVNGPIPPVVERDTTPKQSQMARLKARVADLEDIAALALPYIEEAQSDPAYKPGVVAAFARRIRAAIS